MRQLRLLHNLVLNLRIYHIFDVLIGSIGRNIPEDDAIICFSHIFFVDFIISSQSVYPQV